MLAIGNVIDTQADYPEHRGRLRALAHGADDRQGARGGQGRQLQGRGLRRYSFMKARRLLAGAARHVRGKVPADVIEPRWPSRRRRSWTAASRSRSTTASRSRADVTQAGTPPRAGRSGPAAGRHHQALRRARSPTTRSPSTCARGEVLALLGENGAGKTTLMNILFGHYVADAGRDRGRSARPLPPGRAARRARRRHRHGAPALHAGRQPVRARQHRARHRAAVAAVGSTGGGARTASRELGRDFGLEVDPDAPVGDAVGRRAAAGRDPEGALPRRARS